MAVCLVPYDTLLLLETLLPEARNGTSNVSIAGKDTMLSNNSGREVWTRSSLLNVFGGEQKTGSLIGFPGEVVRLWTAGVCDGSGRT